MTENASNATVGRRDLLKATGAAGVVAAAPVSASRASAQEEGEAGYGGWFDDVSNFDGTEDMRGEDEVTVEVGVEANEGNFGFGPAAVRVDSDTEVVWEWTGEGSQHNVVEQDGAFESDLYEQANETFSYTFQDEGIYLYSCTPHESVGMKGAVVVGDIEVQEGTGSGEGEGDEAAGEDGADEPQEQAGDENGYGMGGPGVEAGDLGSMLVGASMVAAFVSPLLFAVFLLTRRRGSESEPHFPE